MPIVRTVERLTKTTVVGFQFIIYCVSVQFDVCSIIICEVRLLVLVWDVGALVRHLVTVIFIYMVLMGSITVKYDLLSNC